MNWFVVVTFRHGNRVFRDRNKIDGSFGDLSSFLLEYIDYDVLNVTVERVEPVSAL